MKPGTWGQRWLLTAILLLAFGLRLYRLGAESLWYDETVSVHLAGKSLPALVAHTAGDIHPPGYYLLLHAWMRLGGGSDFSAAYLSLFFGLLLVALAQRLAAQRYGPRAGLLAAFLVAISPYNVWYSQEVRMYTLGAVLGMGLLFSVLALLRTPAGARPSAARLGAYALWGALGLWVLYYFAFLLVAANLLVGAWWLVARRRKRAGWAWLAWWALAQGAALALYAPWLPVAWRQATQPPVPPWRGFVGLGQVVVETWSALSLGQSAAPRQVWPVLVLIAGLFALGLARKRRAASQPPGVDSRLLGKLVAGAEMAPRRGREPQESRMHPPPGAAWLLVGYVFLPVGLIYVASLLTPLYHVRYAFLYATPFYVLLAAGLDRMRRRWQPALVLSLAVVTVFCGLSIHAYHSDPQYAADDHRAAARFLADRWRPGDAILVNAGYTYPALLTYWDGEAIAWRGRLVGDPQGDFAQAAGQGPVLVQTGTVDGDPSLGWGDPASDFYAMSREETEAALDRLFAAFDRVWVYRCYDTVTDPSGAIRRWLDEQGLPFEERVFTGESQLRVQGFVTGRDPLAGVGRAHDVPQAGGALRLLGSTVRSGSAPVGAAVDLALVWGVESALEREATLFAGLLDAEGIVWAQADEHPLGTLYPVTAWPVGATVRAPVRLSLPSGTPPGRYHLEVGWYRFVDGQPVWLEERLPLDEVEVAAPEGGWTLPPPEPAQPLHVRVGEGLELLGFDGPALEARPGETLALDLFWLALEDGPEAGRVVLQLADDGGQVLAESASAPVRGRVPFTGLAAGQALRDPQRLTLPGDLAPGVYGVGVGRQRADGTWLPIRRGPCPLGRTYPLVTVRVLGRPLTLTPPDVQHPVNARFGDAIRLVGYDATTPGSPSSGQASRIELVLYWQAVAPTATPHKVFVHLVGDGGGAGEIVSQADLYPHVPTNGWAPGEYLADGAVLEVPPDLPPGDYALLLGFYDEATGARLPAFDEAGRALGDRVVLETIRLGP